MTVYVVANATVDETFDVGRLPAVGESTIGSFRHRDIGGKGANVAVVLARCGVPTTLVAAIGDDPGGVLIQQRLAQESLQLALQITPDAPTDRSLIYQTGDGDNAIVTTVETTRRLEPNTIDAALRDAVPGDILVLQGNLDAALTSRLIDDANARGLHTTLNPSPYAAWLGAVTGHVRTLFVNDGEARALTGKTGEDAVLALLSSGTTEVVLTRGCNGALLGSQRVAPAGDGMTTEPIDRSQSPAVIAVSAVTNAVIDTTGAGDTFMATALASSIRRGVPIDRHALCQAAAAAAVTVSRVGTLAAFPSHAELGTILGT